MPDLMDVWRRVRAGLIGRGVKCPIAETEATRLVKLWKETAPPADFDGFIAERAKILLYGC